MSPERKREFEQEWPELARRLDALLRRKRVPAEQRDDLVQEVALRLLKMWDEVIRGRSAWPLTSTIALNLLRDGYRSRRWTESVADLPDRASSHDVERAGMARIELKRVQKAMEGLSGNHRSVLLAEIGDVHIEDHNLAAHKMLRMRARRRLTELLERVSALFPARQGITDLMQLLFNGKEQLIYGVTCLACLAAGLTAIAPVVASPAEASPIYERPPVVARSHHSVVDPSAVAASSAWRSRATTDLQTARGAEAPKGSKKKSASDDTGATGRADLPSLPSLPSGPAPVPAPGTDIPSGGAPVSVPAPSVPEQDAPSPGLPIAAPIATGFAAALAD
ncbi:MAG TPA: sigma factor, partial [Actinomycetota bacterium]|nr:sigma factor [Actinomycetota bacterium]